MNGVVLDASVLVELVAGEKRTPVGGRADDGLADRPTYGPALLWSEPRNAVLKKTRAGELTSTQRDDILSVLDRFPIRFDETPDRRATVRLAILHGLSVHDAFYLELASRKSLPLATNDRALRRAAQAGGVALV